MTGTASAPRAVAPAGVFLGTAAPGGVRVWRGIRFALAAVGERRFRDPVPSPDLTDETDAADFGPACPQPRTRRSRSARASSATRTACR